MSLESELKKKRRQRGKHLRRSPDPAERRGWSLKYMTVTHS